MWYLRLPFGGVALGRAHEVAKAASTQVPKYSRNLNDSSTAFGGTFNKNQHGGVSSVSFHGSGENAASKDYEHHPQIKSLIMRNLNGNVSQPAVPKP